MFKIISKLILHSVDKCQSEGKTNDRFTLQTPLQHISQINVLRE